MAINIPEAPAETLNALRQTIPMHLASAPAQSRMRAVADSAAPIALTQAHPVYVATLADLVEGHILSRARLVSWRAFLVDAGNEPFAAAETQKSEPAGINEGRFVGGTAEAMIAAENLDEVRGADYELRLLRLPAVYTVAVWLARPEQDILIPAAPVQPPLQPNIPYNEAEFIAALKPLAELRASITDDRA